MGVLLFIFFSLPVLALLAYVIDKPKMGVFFMGLFLVMSLAFVV